MKFNLVVLLVLGLVAFSASAPVEQTQEDAEPEAFEDDLKEEDAPAEESEEIENDQDSADDAEESDDEIESDQDSADNAISKRGRRCRWILSRCGGKWVKKRVCSRYCYRKCHRRVCRNIRRCFYRRYHRCHRVGRRIICRVYRKPVSCRIRRHCRVVRFRCRLKCRRG